MRAGEHKANADPCGMGCGKGTRMWLALAVVLSVVVLGNLAGNGLPACFRKGSRPLPVAVVASNACPAVAATAVAPGTVPNPPRANKTVCCLASGIRQPSAVTSLVLTNAGAAAATGRHFVVYCFYSGTQCPCSSTIETGAFCALATHYPGGMKAGTLVWSKINVAEEEYAHFATDYNLEPLEHLHNGLVMVEVNDGKPGRWQKLGEADALKNDAEQYSTYLKKEMDAFAGPENRACLEPRGAAAPSAK